MMNLERQTTRRLHEEHMAALDLIGRFEQVLVGNRESPVPGDTEWRSVVRATTAGIVGEIERHFDFEEQALFPRLEASGDGQIAQLLTEEHVVIRQVVSDLMDLLHASLAQRLPETEWQTLKMLGLEYVERMKSHVQKEEMALLPALEDALGEDDDEALILAYTSG